MVALAGCGTATAAKPTARPAVAATASANPPKTDPLRIIGDWRVVRARGAAPGTPVRFGDQTVVYRQSCGELGGDWTAARGGLFLAETTGFDDHCLHTADLNPVWLRTATRFRVTGGGSARRLTILAGGRVLAVLRPGAYPKAGPNGSLLPGPEPRVTAAIRAEFIPPRALPAGLTPATAQTLVGRWRPRGPLDPNFANVVLTVRADGGWAGTDGCNVQGGRWESGPGGLLLVDGFAQTLVGCPRAPHASFADAGRAGFDGALLVLLDRTGTVLERLRRA